jgi:hypothetical protein
MKKIINNYILNADFAIACALMGFTIMLFVCIIKEL